MNKVLLSISAGLSVLEGAIPQLPISSDYQSVLAVVCAVAITMISTYTGRSLLLSKISKETVKQTVQRKRRRTK